MSATCDPRKWLLAQLPQYVPDTERADLMARFDANKRAYARQVKIKKAERTIKTLIWRNNPADVPTLSRLREKLARLKAGDL